MSVGNNLIRVLVLVVISGSGVPAAEDALLTGRFHWEASAPLLAAAPATDRSCAIKDPSVVFFGERWHLFATIKQERATIMEQLSFADWKHADAAPRHVINLVTNYHCAPQVFFFRPQQKWYLIYQWADPTPQTGFFGPVFSTLADPGRPETLTPPKMMFPRKPANVPHWIDFWVICDARHAYLFFTGDDGRFWRSRTALADFPLGWSQPELGLQTARDELFEASHTYRLKGREQYLTLIEAIGPGGARYYKAWLADKLDGAWQPLAASWAQPFASSQNIHFASGVTSWTDSVSHGELLREGCDETLTVDGEHLRFLFQGCTAQERAGKKYGQFPWRLGLLEPVVVKK
ncbi:MAG: non-reducing end alpha-L-arabinofuranosidase family hydrolase [Kiritimatiellaeota bacterium]|nr:non-reducing end alpha-L-arabinofuranosidase family hydrolase [Kiritimatiellota bacterium]